MSIIATHSWIILGYLKMIFMPCRNRLVAAFSFPLSREVVNA